MRYKLVILLFILIPISSLQAQNHDPTKASADEVLSHDDLTSATRKVGPPKELIKEWPAPTTSSQPRENIIPGARIIQELKTDRIRAVEAIDGIVVPGATTPQEAAEEFLTRHYELLGLAVDLSNLDLITEKSDEVGHFLKYKQIFGELPVKFGQLNISVDSDLAIRDVALEILPITTPPPSEPFNPTNSEQAIKVALRTINAHWIPNPGAVAEAVVLVEDGEPKVVWEVIFGASIMDLREIPEHLLFHYLAMRSWIVLVDAETLRPVGAYHIGD